MTAAIVLAGAHVWQDDSLESLCPRALLPLANVPLLEYVLRWLHEGGVRDVTVCTNELGPRMVDVLEKFGRAGVEWRIYQDRLPRGPAGCARDAAELVPAPDYVVVDASVLPGVDLAELQAAHRQADAWVTLAVERDEADGLGGDTPTGIYLVSAAALEQVPPTGYQDLKEMLLPRLYRAAARVQACRARRPSPRVEGLATYLALHEWLLERLAANGGVAGHRSSNGLMQHPTASVAESARIMGAVLLGENTRVEADAIITGPTAIGEGCTVGCGAVVVRSVLWEHCEVGAGAMVTQSVVARAATVGSGTTHYGAIYRGADSRWGAGVAS